MNLKIWSLILSFGLTGIQCFDPLRLREYILDLDPAWHPDFHYFDNSQFRVLKTFQSDVFHGIAVKILQGDHDVLSLATIEGVLNVWVNHRIKLPPSTPRKVDGETIYSNYSVHDATGVTKLHRENNKGKGVKVGILDTGVWHSHPAMGDCLHEDTCVIQGGYNFLSNGFPVDDDGHGTQVASIIAGKGKNFIGVAPEASLYIYKILERGIDVTYDTIMEALLKAYYDGCDVINVSLGRPAGFQPPAWAFLAARLVDKGIVVVTPAGDRGHEGHMSLNDGATEESLIAVAATKTMPQFPASFMLAGLEEWWNHFDKKWFVEWFFIRFGYLPAGPYFPIFEKHMKLLPFEWKHTDPHLCKPIIKDPPLEIGKGRPHNPIGDPKKYIALLAAGECDLQTKHKHLQEIGIDYFLVYNATGPLFVPSNAGNSTPFVGSIDRAVVEKLYHLREPESDFGKPIGKTKFISEPQTKWDPEDTEEISTVDPTGVKASPFSSWGPTHNFQLKPDVSAPGEEIVSPWTNNEWVMGSSSDLAAAYVSGLAALYISRNGGREKHGPGFAQWLRKRMITSARTFPRTLHSNRTKDFGLPASVAQTGAGMIDGRKLVETRMELQAPSLALLDHNFNGRFEFPVINKSKDKVKYMFSHKPGAGFFMMPPRHDRARLWNSYEELEVQRWLDVQVDLPKEFELKPGANKTVKFNFNTPRKWGWDAQLPLFNGRIQIRTSNGDIASLPYLGVASDWKIDFKSMFEPWYPRGRTPREMFLLQDDDEYTMKLDPEEQDIPRLVVKNIYTAEEVRWDIFNETWEEKQWQFPPKGTPGYIGSATAWYSNGSVAAFDPYEANPYEDVTRFPWFDVDRIPPKQDALRHEFFWFGGLANGTLIQPGTYRMRFAMLKPMGNRQVSEDWSKVVLRIKISGQIDATRWGWLQPGHDEKGTGKTKDKGKGNDEGSKAKGTGEENVPEKGKVPEEENGLPKEKEKEEEKVKGTVGK